MEKKLNFAASLLTIAASMSLILSLMPHQRDVTTCSVKYSPVVNKIFFDRIFMHETNHYSVFSVKEDKSVEINSYQKNYKTRKIELICDVEIGDRMWAEVKSDEVMLHIHCLSDLNGAGWNHGKFGNGNMIDLFNKTTK